MSLCGRLFFFLFLGVASGFLVHGLGFKGFELVLGRCGVKGCLCFQLMSSGTPPLRLFTSSDEKSIFIDSIIACLIGSKLKVGHQKWR